MTGVLSQSAAMETSVKVGLLFSSQICIFSWCASEIKPDIWGHWGQLTRYQHPKILREVLRWYNDVCFWHLLPFPSLLLSISWELKTCLKVSAPCFILLSWRQMLPLGPWGQDSTSGSNKIEGTCHCGSTGCCCHCGATCDAWVTSLDL